MVSWDFKMSYNIKIFNENRNRQIQRVTSKPSQRVTSERFYEMNIEAMKMGLENSIKNNNDGVSISYTDAGGAEDEDCFNGSFWSIGETLASRIQKNNVSFLKFLNNFYFY